MAQDTVTDKNRRAGAGYLFAIIASVGLGSAVAFSRASYDGGTDPLSVSTVRAVFGSCLVGLFCVLSGRSLRVPRRLWPHLLCLGLMIGYMFYGNIGAVQYIPIGLAALLFFVYPPLVAVFVAILDRGPVGGLKAVALIGAFVGRILMLGVDLDTIDWRGVALALAAGVLAAVNAVWIARVMHGMDVLVLTFYMSAVGAVVLLIATAGAGGRVHGGHGLSRRGPLDAAPGPNPRAPRGADGHPRAAGRGADIGLRHGAGRNPADAVAGPP